MFYLQTHAECRYLAAKCLVRERERELWSQVFHCMSCHHIICFTIKTYRLSYSTYCASRTNQLYNLSHFCLDTAQLSPLLDMSGCIHAQATSTFIFHCDRCYSLVLHVVLKPKKLNFNFNFDLTFFFFLTMTYGLYFY